MMQVLVYIAENYIWFLGGSILILLAVIGYYADKTNFGQGKNIKNNEEEKTLNLENMKLNDALNDDVNVNNLEIERNKNGLNPSLESLNIDSSMSEVQDYIIPENLTDVNLNVSEVENANLDLTNNSNVINGNFNLTNENLIETPNSQLINSKNEDSLLIEENFNRFNEEFNSILPRKGLISNDLLNDIDDLELGKTQKIDLVNVPNLDDIELPKIKTFVEEEQDIWKF